MIVLRTAMVFRLVFLPAGPAAASEDDGPTPLLEAMAYLRPDADW